MEAIFRHDLLSWGRKDGGTARELIPELAWQMGNFDHRAGKLVYRHPAARFPRNTPISSSTARSLIPGCGSSEASPSDA